MDNEVYKCYDKIKGGARLDLRKNILTARMK